MNVLRRRRNLIIVLVVAIVIGVAAGLTVPRLFGPDDAAVQPPLFMVYIPSIGGELEGVGFINNWESPAAVVVAGDRLVVLDTSSERLIVLDADEKVVAVLGDDTGEGLRLRVPEGLAAAGSRLFVANTGAGEVIIMTLAGDVERTISLPVGAQGQEPRPSGITVLPDGSFYVSDTANNAVLHYGSDGSLLGTMDDDSAEPYSFNEPRGLATDRFGSLYVADTESGSVKKISPAGKLQAQFSLEGEPDFSRPVAVAVGEDGTIYFSDRKRRLIQVHSQANDYVGVIGLYDASRVDSVGVLKDPYGLWMQGDRLFVADREEGIFAFDIDPRYWVEDKEDDGVPLFHGD